LLINIVSFQLQKILVNRKIPAMAENVQNLASLLEKRNKTLKVISQLQWIKTRVKFAL